MALGADNTINSKHLTRQVAVLLSKAEIEGTIAELQRDAAIVLETPALNALAKFRTASGWFTS